MSGRFRLSPDFGARIENFSDAVLPHHGSRDQGRFSINDSRMARLAFAWPLFVFLEADKCRSARKRCGKVKMPHDP